MSTKADAIGGRGMERERERERESRVLSLDGVYLFIFVCLLGFCLSTS